MTEVGGGFWSAVDKQSVVTGSGGSEQTTKPRISPAPVLVSTKPEPVRMPIAALEWSGIVDIINAAKTHAEAQNEQLQEQAQSFQRTIQELREEAEAIRQQVRVSEVQAREAKAAAEQHMAAMLIQAEMWEREVQAKADAQIAEARHAARSPEERAATAEGWLARISEATRALPSAQVVASVQRAA